MLFNVINLEKAVSHEGMILVPKVINLKGKQVTVGYWRYPEGVKGPKGQRKAVARGPREPVPEPKTSYEKQTYDERVRLQETVEATEDKLSQAKRQLKKIKGPQAGSKEAIDLIHHIGELESSIEEFKSAKVQIKLNLPHLEEEVSKKVPKFARHEKEGVVTHTAGFQIYADPESESLVIAYVYPKTMVRTSIYRLKDKEVKALAEEQGKLVGVQRGQGEAIDLISPKAKDKEFKGIANSLAGPLARGGWDFNIDSASRQIRIYGYAGGGVTKHIIDLKRAKQKVAIKKGLPGLVAQKVTVMMSGHPYQGVRWVNPNPKTAWRRTFIDKYNLGGIGSELGFNPDIMMNVEKAFNHLSKALVVDGNGELKLTIGAKFTEPTKAEYYSGKHLIQIYGEKNTESLSHEYGHWIFDRNVPNFPSSSPKSWDSKDVIAWQNKIKKVAKVAPVFELITNITNFYKKKRAEFEEFSNSWAASQPNPKEFGDDVRNYLFTPQEMFARAVEAYVEQDLKRSYFAELEDDPNYWDIVNQWGAKYLKTGLVKSLGGLNETFN